jgi:predicted Zn-dependent peptidase
MMKLFERTTKSGLRLQAISMPGTNVVTTMVLVGAGSRYETKENTGLSHFLEHMFFKGAKKYKSPKEVSEAVDSFGGEFNAFTGKEYAGYYVKSGQENLDTSLSVLSDMLIEATFPAAEIEKERGVILEEMAMYQDAPMYQISWDFERLVFGDQPLGWDQIGTAEVIKNISRDAFVAYKESQYVADNMIIVCAGAVDETTLDKMETMFPVSTKPRGIPPTPFESSFATDTIKLRNKKTEQYHLSFGVKTPAETDPLFPALKVLGVALGGNMSSRMFQRVRETQGLCYSIRTNVDEYSDTGLMTTRAGVKVTEVLKAVAAIRHEYDEIATNGITPEECTKAINYLIGKTDLSTEDTEDVAHEYAKNALLYGNVETYEDWKNKVRAVKLEDVNQMARELFKPENLRFAGIGPTQDEEALKKLLE